MLEAVPADKVLLGVPFYGLDFKTGLKDHAVLAAVPDSLDNPDPPRTITPAVVQALLGKGYYTTSKGAKIEIAYWIEKGVWSDEYAATRYSFVDTDNNLHILYCDDERSLRIKGSLMAFDRLGGVAVWEMVYGTDGMWNALSDGMTAQ
jgi:spore germination protein YaaH